MSNKQLFESFSEEEQEKFADEAETLYDPETVLASNKKWKAYYPEKKQAILEEGRQIYVDMIAAIPKGAEAPEVQALVERWRKHMDYFWTPEPDQLVLLAEGYNNDPRFRSNFDKMDPRLATFLLDAIKIYVST